MKTLTIFLFAAVFAFVGQSCFGGGMKIHVLEIERIELDNMIHYERDSFSYYQTVFDSDVIMSRKRGFIGDESHFCTTKNMRNAN